MLGGWRGGMQRAGDVGRGLLVLRAAVEEEELVGLHGAVGLRRGSVVDDGGVWSGAGDGEERVGEVVGLRAAVGLDAGCNVEFGEFAGGGFSFEPAEGLDERAGIAEVCETRGREFGGVFAGFGGKDGRARAFDDASAGGEEEIGGVCGGVEFVDPPATRGVVEQCGFEALVGLDADVGGESGADVGGDAVGVGEERRAAGCDDGVRKKEGVERDVGGAEIEQPGDGVEGGDRVGLRAGAREVVAERGEFLGVGDTGEGEGVRADGGGGRRWARGPGGVDEIAGRVDEGDCTGLEGLLQVEQCAPGHGARVDADDRAFGEALEELAKSGDVGRAGALKRDAFGVELLLGLGPVSAVGPEVGAVEEDERVAGGAGEAGDKSAAVGAWRRVLGLMLVGGRDEERVERGRCGAHGGADCREDP